MKNRFIKFLCSCFGLTRKSAFDQLYSDYHKLQRRNDSVETQLGEMMVQFYNDEISPRFETDTEWDEVDAAALETFFKTPSGQRLKRRFRSVAAAVAVHGSKDVMHTAHSAGASFGWSEACEWFLKLSRVSRVPDTKPEEAPEGEEQLLDRMSP